MISPENLMQKSTELGLLNDEFHWRQSTHLAYYAVYHKLLEFANLRNVNLNQGSGGMHIKAITAIGNYSEQGLKLAYCLKKMKKLRVDADYYISKDFSQEDALKQQNLMQQCLADLAIL